MAEKKMAQYTIKDMESLSGVKAHTLRIWEQRYDFLKPHRTETNIRFYDDEQLRNILNISALNRSGVKISQLASMEMHEIKEKVLSLQETAPDPNNYLDALTHSMIDFDESRFEKTISCALLRLGFDRTFSELIFPFLKRTGILWITGAIQPGQEHFISNLIRRKLIVAIDNQYVNKTIHSKKFLLFLPESEMHELMLLYTEYLLRKSSHDVNYLGSGVPFESIKTAVRLYNPDYLFTYLTMPFKDISAQSYINDLAGINPNVKLILGGPQIACQKLKIPANTICIKDEKDLSSFFSSKSG